MHSQGLRTVYSVARSTLVRPSTPCNTGHRARRFGATSASAHPTSKDGGAGEENKQPVADGPSEEAPGDKRQDTEPGADTESQTRTRRDARLPRLRPLRVRG